MPPDALAYARDAAQPRAPDGADFPGVQLHVVTGKGGTGKSTVAAALALALAAARQATCCCARSRAARASPGCSTSTPLPYEERRIAVGLRRPAAGDVYALAIDAESALLEYLAMYYRLGRAGKALDRFGVIDFATTIAPGVRDVLLTGKVYEAAQRNGRNKGAPQYDAVVLDAPPTGRIAQFLNVNSELAGLAKVGPDQAPGRRVMTLLRSPRTAVHLVTVLEEMPVQETADGIAELRAAGLPVGGVVVNLVRPRDLDADDLAAAARRHARPRRARRRPEGGRRSRPTTTLVDGLLDEAHDHAERRALEDAPARARRPASTSRPTSCPRLPGGIDLGGALRARRRCSASRGWHDQAARRHQRSRGRARVGPLAAAPRRRRAALDVDALLDDPAPGSSSAAAPAASARPPPPPPWRCAPPSAAARSSCSPSTRPAGWRSRWASSELDNTPRPVHRRRGGRRAARLDAMMLDMKRTFDEVVESQATPGEGAADPGQPLLHRAVELVRGHAGVHGDGEARPAPRGGAARRALGPDRRRHPAVALGAGLPRRPGAALELPRRPVHPAAAGAGAGPGAADDGRVSGWSPTR